jgi:uncharacterized membrane protein
LRRLRAHWLDARDSLWFIPSVLTVVAILGALGSVEIDRRFIQHEDARGYFLIFGSGADGARGVLSAIAQSMMTVTGVVFSITIIALQLASSQYSPRVLPRFMDDRANQTVLGIFIGTFVYSLLVLRFVRSDDEYVPSLSVSLAVLLTLVMVGALIFFINHIANSLKPEIIAARTAWETREVITHLYPDERGGEADPVPREPGAGFEPRGTPAPVRSTRSGYVQAVDLEHFAEGLETPITLELERSVGAFVIDGEPLVSVWPASAVTDELAERLRRAYTIGDERTLHQDMERGLVELVDMAVKALSPAVYEPTTARLCIHRLTELLVQIGRRAPASRFRTFGEGRLSVITHRNTFESSLRLAVRPIRRYGGDQAAVAIWLLKALGRVASLVPTASREALTAEVEETLARAEDRIGSSVDLSEIREAADDALRRIRE